jgi:uncharacterized phage protein (TIGR02218 family)
MIILPSAAQTHLSGDALTVAFCIEIAKIDGTFLRLTSHSASLIVASNTYHADVGSDATAIKLVNNMSVGGGDMSTLIKSSFITEADILAGKYNGADYKIFIVDFTQPDLWQVTLTTGLLGELKIEGEQFTTELRSLSQKLNKVIGEYYSPGCRAQLYDARCTVNPAAFSYSGVVETVTDNASFTGTPTKAADFFKYGRVLWLTGANAGLVSEIKTSGAAKEIVLFIDANAPIAIGDTYTIREGCDKNFQTCKTKFSNHLNFRGEPHIPGIEKAFIARL